MCEGYIKERIKDFWTAYWIFDYLYVMHYRLIGETEKTYEFNVEGERYKVVKNENGDVVGVDFEKNINEKTSVLKQDMVRCEMFDTRGEAIDNIVWQLEYELKKKCRWRVRRYAILIIELLKLAEGVNYGDNNNKSK